MRQSRSNNKQVPYVVFGAWDHPTKTLQAFRWKGMKGIGVSICELGNEDQKYHYGDLTSNDDIVGRYINLWFCRKESLDAVIRGFVKLREMMEEQDEQVD